MLTPEERARAVVTNFQGDNYWIDTEAAIVAVAEGIQAAVEEERKRGEQAILSIRADYPEDIFTGGAGEWARIVIDRVLAAYRTPIGAP